jgi:hypothetical protein
MNRRKFLKWVGIGTAVATVAPAIEFTEPAVETLTEWNNYTNFSSFAISQAIDETVTRSAIELEYAVVQSISELHAAAF